MPSLFARSRTQSSPNKKLSLPTDDNRLTSDEFGRVSSRSSNRGISSAPTPAKKDKKRDKDDRLWSRSAPKDRPDTPALGPDLQSVPDGSFLPLCLDRPIDETGVELPLTHPYGYLSYERYVILGLDQVSRLVTVVAHELESRGGFTTPFIFSSLALDISAPAIKRLIQTFLATCVPYPPADAERRWRDEARFAGMHELGMCLRWGLARVVRRVGGLDVRGFISWDHYVQFRDSESALHYPPTHFSTFLSSLSFPLQEIIQRVLTLLSRMTAHSASSGHTPPTLSPLFGPLLFGLGPPTLAFHHTYVHYLWAANATEHILLAFIRWQDSPTSIADPNATITQGTAAALGIPTRLKDWIRGYPAMLPFLKDSTTNHKPQARRGARTVRVVSVRRNVRMYSPDLVKTAASWGQRPQFGAPRSDRGLSSSKEWDRIAPTTLKLQPRYSDPYRKRMDMPQNFHPDIGVAGLPLTSASSSTSSGTSASFFDEKDYLGVGTGLLAPRKGEDRFRSLTDLKWGEFETMGFGGIEPDEKKLQFDLTEGARTARAAKRSTLSWNDFSSSGFTRTEVPLNATLQFSTPVATTISSWPSHSAEISKKLKKTQRALPPFGWDTEPIIGSEEMVEEAFLDVFCDLIYGGGWMDAERGEDTDRECNWALVEFKALPSQRSVATESSDPRTASVMLLFEEFVPFEYRQQLAEGHSGRRRLPALFSTSSKSKQWKQATTLNGRPYVVGLVPRSPSYREVEFEGLLRGTGATKVISLGTKTPRIPSMAITLNNDQADKAHLLKPEPVPPLPSKTKAKSEDGHATQPPPPPPSDSTGTPLKKPSRFRLPGGIPVPSPGGVRKSGRGAPAEYSTVDFETRMASYSDDEYEPGGKGKVSEAERQARRESKDDAWMEILVGTQDRRMGGQEAEFRKPGGKGSKSGDDPESVSMEVAQALAGIERAPFSDDEGDEREAETIPDDSIDEVQIVPRRMAMYDFTGQLDVERDSRREYEAEDELEPEPVTEPSLELDEHDHEHDEGEYQDEDQDQDLGGEQNQALSASGLTYRQQQKAQRRLGYFDLHPERRPVSVQDEDPRQRLENNSDEEEEADDEDIYGPPESHHYIPPLVPRKPASSSSANRNYESLSPTIDIPEYVPAEGRAPEWENSRSAKVTALPTTGTAPYKGNGNGNAAAAARSNSTSPSKTAALIEMYRKRERGASLPQQAASSSTTTATTPTPSRLPIRALPATPRDVLPPPPQVHAAPAIIPLEPQVVDIPRATIEESPARYVHGAPLHRVLEEEEASNYQA